MACRRIHAPLHADEESMQSWIVVPTELLNQINILVYLRRPSRFLEQKCNI